MKKLLLLTALLLTGGFALPAAAQSYRSHASPTSHIFISGYLSCGTPIYSKQVRHGQRHYTQRLSTYELRQYLRRQRQLAQQRQYQQQRQRDYQRRSLRSRYQNNRSLSRSNYYQNRCR